MLVCFILSVSKNLRYLTLPFPSFFSFVNIDELTAQVLVDMVKSKPVITVREVVAGLKPYLQSSKRDVNVGKLKELMKTYCIQDKKSGVVSLKPAFKTL